MTGVGEKGLACLMTGSVRMRCTSGSCMARACRCFTSSSDACPVLICDFRSSSFRLRQHNRMGKQRLFLTSSLSRLASIFHYFKGLMVAGTATPVPFRYMWDFLPSIPAHPVVELKLVAGTIQRTPFQPDFLQKESLDLTLQL